MQGLAEAQKHLPGTLHRASNIWIRLTSETTAVSESYVIARLETTDAGVAMPPAAKFGTGRRPCSATARDDGSARRVARIRQGRRV